MWNRRSSVATLAVLVLAACGPSREVREQLAQLSAVSAEKDTLLQQVAENSRLMSEISAQLVTVADRERLAEVGAKAESPMAASRDSLRVMVGDVATRIAQSEERLKASQRRIRALTRTSDSARTVFEATIADLQATIDNQKVTIAALTTQVENLQAENVQLATEKAALTDTVEQLATEKRTAYYVIGTKDELIDRGSATRSRRART
jgi:chromosome segregation ATPase